jgi:hypothetical protein
MTPDDLNLKRVFSAMRTADARRGVPDFAAGWSRAVRAATWRSRLRSLIVAGTAIAAGVALVVTVERRSAPSAAGWDVIRWESPTAFLLRGPGDALLRDLPTLGSSGFAISSTPNVAGGTR